MSILISLPSLLRPISLVVTYPPGGGADAMARLIAPKLGEALGRRKVAAHVFETEEEARAALRCGDAGAQG